MKHTPCLLDLACIPDWLSVTRQIVNQVVPETLRAELRGFNPADMYYDTMSFLVESGIKNGYYRDGECIEVDDWSEDFDAAFLAHFTSIRAFHSCRTFGSLDHYKTRGVQKLSRTLLRQLAHAAFAGHAGPDEIDRAVDSRPIPAFEKSVFLFTDSVHPLAESQNHYLHSGSEMLQALAIDLRLHSRRILASQGEAYLIECHVPLTHVSKGFRWQLWRMFVTQHFRIEAGSATPTKPYDFCIRVTESISPTAIQAFHRIDLKGIVSQRPPH